MKYIWNRSKIHLHVLCFATAENAIVGVAWITDWPCICCVELVELAEDAVTDAIVGFPCNVGAGACCCTAGLLWTVTVDAAAATAAANVGAPEVFILFEVWLPVTDDAVAAATTAAAVCCCVWWFSCCVWGWWWFLLGVELIILLVGAARYK